MQRLGSLSISKRVPIQMKPQWTGGAGSEIFDRCLLQHPMGVAEVHCIRSSPVVSARFDEAQRNTHDRSHHPPGSRADSKCTIQGSRPRQYTGLRAFQFDIAHAQTTRGAALLHRNQTAQCYRRRAGAVRRQLYARRLRLHFQERSHRHLRLLQAVRKRL